MMRFFTISKIILMEKFDEMLQKEESLGYIYRLAKESDKMLQAILANDTKTMEKILSYVHDTETPILSFIHMIKQ